MLDFLALLIVGDSVLTLLNPRRHLLLWDFGPKPCQRMIDSLVQHPVATRWSGAAGLLLGAWLAESQRPA